MAPDGNSPGSKARSDAGPHEELLELCAVSTTGELNKDERRRLREHFEVCAECRQALTDFEAVANIGAPLFSSELAASDAHQALAKPSELTKLAAAKRRFKDAALRRSESRDPNNGRALVDRKEDDRAIANWEHIWLSLAAAILLVVALGMYSLEIGKSRTIATVQENVPTGAQTKIDGLEQQLSDAGHERELLTAQLAAKDRHIAGLQRKIDNQVAARSAAKAQQANLQESLQSARNENQEMAQQQADASQKLATTQASLESVQLELDSLRREHSQDELRAANLETRMGDLEKALTSSQRAVNKQQDLLSEDADVRDLMGARDLYIAEVYDVGRDGSTQKPYGRVFYTKGKSLIFYAYDLDRQPGAKPGSAFQAWGQSGPDKQKSVNLGAFFEDNVMKKRWVLKFDDAHALEQINAVFVTVESNGGRQTPSGNPLLFASLKIEPNHP